MLLSSHLSDDKVGSIPLFDYLRWKCHELVNLRVLINEAGGIVDLVVNYQIQVLFVGVRSYLGVGKFFRHADCVAFVSALSRYRRGLLRSNEVRQD
jgi:hypothetical protein